ncbi:acyl-CoA dehydrogenase family protein [Actinosynnema pretiosum]|uniref:Oxidoreductase n=1 Tax=Actinosynnema pretiosum TaxID=42197 RepID=A0A290Z897_9PSEU|nr:acyl-CoA dehydrogenase family protein [Actinosynnema pretiosum]ATE55214.1 oxidoreductase [Actinosynnema pretiosum]
MRTLDDAREVCEAHLPGLLGKLAQIPLAELEKPGNPGLELFKSCGGPALLIPERYSGSGATPLQALRITRAIGAAAPSLSVATTMHHFSVATIFTLAESLRSSGVEWALLEGIATQSLLVSSGFAEGNPGQGILSPTVAGVRAEGGIVVNGAKRPCSMSRSMDLLSASVSVPSADGGSETVLMLLPAQTPGVSVHPFWGSNVLAGAESDEVRLTDVFVDDRLLVPTEVGERGELDELQTVGFMWFEMLITACYLGMASALVERVLDAGKLSPEQFAELGVRLETAALLLEGIAGALAAGEGDNAALTRTMIARYGAQDAIVEVAGRAVEALGGMAFIASPDVAYLASAAHCSLFHPPSKSATRRALAESFAGDVLRIA